MRSIARVGMLVACCFSLDAAAARFDIAHPAHYTDAHRALALELDAAIQAPAARDALLASLRQHQRALPLREVCNPCATEAKARGLDDDFEPEVWLYEPAAGKRGANSDLLIAYPPAGDDKRWRTVEALSVDGDWRTLDAHTAPDAPVLVVRVNGRFSMEKQLESANAMLRDAGLQSAPLPQGKASGHWTTRLESISLNDDEEPWISGAAEVYAVTSGVLPGNQPQIKIVDMPYLDYDKTTYYPRQIVLDWADYTYGVANIQLFEHDDNTNYRDLVTAIITGVGAAGSLAGYPVIQAIAEIANRIVAAMPDSWLTNDDDYVDSLYTVEKTVGETRRGARGNALVRYIPYELPSN